jgi:UDP-N-acetylmuramate--alanine ligase
VADALVRHGHPSVDHEADLSKVPARLAECVRPGDMVLTLGAGDVFKVAEAFVALDAASGTDETERKS